MKKSLQRFSLVVATILFATMVYAQKDVTFTVIDETNSFSKLQMKGSYDSWAALTDLTKGTEGVEGTPWTCTISIADGTDYEWGFIQDDGSDNGIWLVEGVNNKFSVSGDAVTGVVNDTIPFMEPATVTFSVNMTNYIRLGEFVLATDSVGISGTINEWGYTKMTQNATNDSVFEISINEVKRYSEHKFRMNEEWEGAPNRPYDLKSDETGEHILETAWYNNVNPDAVKVDVVIKVQDDNYMNVDLGTIQFKGEANGWTAVDMFDDGTNGDETAGDHIWTYVIADVSARETPYEWGCMDKDDNWLVKGDNLTFSVNNDASVTGATLYTIAAWGSETVTFQVDMNCLINDDVFDPDTICVDINIDGYPPVEMTKDFDTRYGTWKAEVTRFNVDEVLNYTYRMDCKFHEESDPLSAYDEYPSFDENRVYTVLTGTNETGIELYQDDVQTEYCDPLSVKEFDGLGDILVFPNPSTSVLYLENLEKVNIIMVSNIIGQRIETIEKFDNSYVLDLNGYETGIYMITFMRENGERGTVKVIKQ